MDGDAVESDDPDLDIPPNLFHTDKFGQKFNKLNDFDALFGEISVDAVRTIAPLTGLGLGLGLMGNPKSIFREKFAQTLRNGLYGGYMEFLLCIC